MPSSVAETSEATVAIVYVDLMASWANEGRRRANEEFPRAHRAVMVRACGSWVIGRLLAGRTCGENILAGKPMIKDARCKRAEIDDTIAPFSISIIILNQ